MSEHIKRFYISCGLPGTGKTTTLKSLAEFLKINTYIISRDEIRCDLIWEYRNLPRQEKNKKIYFLDREVDMLVKRKIWQTVEEDRINQIFIDGCYTNANSLLTLIYFIKNLDCETLVNIIFIGDEFSKCNHKLSELKEGDYSDYKVDKTHDTIPKCVFNRKKEELTELFEKYLNALRISADCMFFLTAYTAKEDQKI